VVTSAESLEVGGEDVLDPLEVVLAIRQIPVGMPS
jgi:hypothetical protein